MSLPVEAAPRPLPAWVQAHCPRCDCPLTTRFEYRPGAGYLTFWVCLNPGCRYRQTLDPSMPTASETHSTPRW